MRILHLCDYIQPKLGYQEYFLSKEHAKMGHEVVVIAADRYYPFPNYDSTVKKILGERKISPGTYKLDGFKIIRLKTIFEIGTKVWLKGLKKEISKFNPDVVICHGMQDFNAIRIGLYKNKFKFKLIYDDHSLFSEAKSGIKGFLFYKFYPYNLILNKGDKLIGVANEVVNFIVRYFKFPKSRVQMIPLGADSDKFKFNKTLKRNFLKKHGILKSNVVLTYTGKLTMLKGPHNILLAIKKINFKLNFPLTILFVGNIDKNYASFFLKITKQIKNNNVKIIQIPAVSNLELVSVYSASDLAVWPRQASMSMIEAMSCSVPIIGCDFLTERFKNNNGIPVKEDNINQLANAILFLVNNPTKRKKMGLNGRELVENELSWNKIAKKFIDFN